MRSRLDRVFSAVTAGNEALGRKNRSLLLEIVWGVVLLLGLLRLLLPESLQYSFTVMGGVLLSGLIALLSYEKGAFSGLRLCALPTLLILGIGLCFLVNALVFRVLAYFAIGMLFAVGLPLLYLCLFSFGPESSILAFAEGTGAAFVLVLIASLLFGPTVGDSGYASFFGNTNLFGYFLIASTAAILLLLYTTEAERRGRKSLLYCLLFIALTLCVLTRSRTSLLSVLAQLLFYFVTWCVRAAKNKSLALTWAAFCRRLVLFALIVVTTFTAFCPLKIYAARQILRHTDEAAAAAFEKEQPTSEEILRLTFAYLFKGLGASEDDEDLLDEPGAEALDDEDVFTSGRKEIWKRFYHELRFLGHADETLEVVEKTRHYAATNAHNVYLQLAFSAGIPAGLLMLLLALLVFVRTAVRVIREYRAASLSLPNLFLGLSGLAFAFPSLTSSGYMPYVYYPATLFWISLMVLCVKKDGAENAEKQEVK